MMKNVKTMKNVRLPDTQTKGYANPKQILLEDIAPEAVIVPGTSSRSAKIMNVKNYFQVEIDFS